MSREFEDVEVSQIPGSPGIFGIDCFRQQKGNHLFIAASVRAQALLDGREVMVVRGSSNDDVTPGQYHDISDPVSRKLELARGRSPVIRLGDTIELEQPGDDLPGIDGVRKMYAGQ